MTGQERRSKNLHTLAELEADGNRTISINETLGSLSMKRGNTITLYKLVDNKYWTPVHAYTR